VQGKLYRLPNKNACLPISPGAPAIRNNNFTRYTEEKSK